MQVTKKGESRANAAATEYGVPTAKQRLEQCRAAAWRGTFSAPLRRPCGVSLTEEERRALMFVFGNLSRGLRVVALSRSVTLRDVVEIFRDLR